jgi:hypothetical protein
MPALPALKFQRENERCRQVVGIGGRELFFESGSRQKVAQAAAPSCLLPGFDGALFFLEWKDALWARFFTGAPPRQRRCVERYSIVMSGRRSQIKGCLP